MHSMSLRLSETQSDFFYTSWVDDNVRSKSPFLGYLFTFNVVITHRNIAFQDIYKDKYIVQRYFISKKKNADSVWYFKEIFKYPLDEIT